MKLLGLDVGTTGCKALLFDEDGTLLAKAACEYAVDMPQPHWAEQDSEAVWLLAQQTIRQAIASAGVDEVAALALSVHGEAVTPVDAQGRALRPTILGMDTRTDPQNAWLRQQIGGERLFHLTGMPVHTINTLPKLLWIKQHEPEIWRGAAQFLLVEDFLIAKLSGKAAISQCLASRTQLLDLWQGEWSAEILSALELEPARLAAVAPSGAPAAEMSAAVAASLGLKCRPLIVAGGHDQACGALGVGLTSAGLAMVSTGTAEVVEVAYPTPTLPKRNARLERENDPTPTLPKRSARLERGEADPNPAFPARVERETDPNPALPARLERGEEMAGISRTLYEGNISVYRHVVPGLFLAMTLNHSGGLVLRWFRDTFCQAEVQQAAQTGADAYDLILAGASPDPTGLLLLPHFAGSGTPTFDTQSKGALLGLTFATRRLDLAKAILEGLTYELRLNLDLLKAGGVQIDALRAIGGGARSPLWLQLKADLTGIPVVVPRITEAAGFGAALLAGVGAGLYPSAAEAAARFLQLTDTYLPDPLRHAAYTRHYERYRQVYPAVAPIVKAAMPD